MTHPTTDSSGGDDHPECSNCGTASVAGLLDGEPTCLPCLLSESRETEPSPDVDVDQGTVLVSVPEEGCADDERSLRLSPATASDLAETLETAAVSAERFLAS